MKSRLLNFCLIFLWFVSLCFGYKYEDTMKRTFTINPDGIVNLETLRGNIEISTASGNEVYIRATVMSDSHPELEKVQVKFEADAGSVTATADGNLAESKVDIDYYLRVPEKLTSVRIITHSGEIKAKGEYKDIDLKTGNSDIDFKGNFTKCRLTTANGDIDVHVKGILGGDLSAKSINGSIEVELKPGSRFIIRGGTQTGSIRSDFECRIAKDIIGSKIEGTLHDGAYNIHLNTINGNIGLYSQ